MARHLLSIGDLTNAELLYLSDPHGKEQVKAPRRAGEILGLLFQQPSLRTMSSFAAGGAMLGLTPIPIQTTGDAFRDQCDFDDEIVQLGLTTAVVAARKASPMNRGIVLQCERPVVNAGDGSNEHPTQALVDLTVMRQHDLDVSSRIVLMGNLRDHRVHHSLALGLQRFGMQVTKLSPPGLTLPDRFDCAAWGQCVTESPADVDAVLSAADFVYLTSCQFWGSPGLRAGNCFSLNLSRVRKIMKRGAKIMHPFPRFGELSCDLDDSEYNAYSDQARTGPWTRHRVLDWIMQADGEHGTQSQQVSDRYANELVPA